MRVSGARTPEELDTLLEDALINHDREALATIFEPGAVLIETTRQNYFAGCGEVLQAHDTALLVAERSISVAVRRDGCWRFAIALLNTSKNGDRHD